MTFKEETFALAKTLMWKGVWGFRNSQETRVDGEQEDSGMRVLFRAS